MKKAVWLGAVLGSTLFAWLGAVLFDHGNMLGGWSLLLGIIGAIPGGWVAYKIVDSL